MEWREERAKGGGVDAFSGDFTIQDDLDRGGWNLYLTKVHVPTIVEAKDLAERLQAVLDAPLGTSLPETADGQPFSMDLDILMSHWAVGSGDWTWERGSKDGI